MPLHPHSVDEHPIPDERAAPILSTSTRSSKKRAPPKRPASGGIETRAQKRARAASSVQDRGTAVPLDDEDRKPAISSDDEDDEIVFLEVIPLHVCNSSSPDHGFAIAGTGNSVTKKIGETQGGETCVSWRQAEL